MNSFYLYAICLSFLLFPVSIFAQGSSFSSNPIHPLSLLSDPSDARQFIQLKYTSPYGIGSFTDFGLRYNQPLSRGHIVSGFSGLGIKRYYQYSINLGYILQIGSKFQAGLVLNGDMFPLYMSGPYRIILGSSFFSSYNYEDWIVCYIHLDNWTDLVLSDKYPGREAQFTFSSKFITPSDINIIVGILYKKASIPLLRFGISILKGQPHTFMTGMQSGPTGFWLGYKLETKKLNFIFSLQTSGVFGYEPGSSFKYYFK